VSEERRHDHPAHRVETIADLRDGINGEKGHHAQDLAWDTAIFFSGSSRVETQDRDPQPY